MAEQVIPAEAVEAAAYIVGEAVYGDLTTEDAARQILEAAAPHMLAAAWDACANLPSRPRPEDNPYRPTP